MHIGRARSTVSPMNSPKTTDSAHRAYPEEIPPFTGTACQLFHWTDQCCSIWTPLDVRYIRFDLQFKILSGLAV